MPRRLRAALAQFRRALTGVSVLALLGALLAVTVLPAQAREAQGSASPRSFSVPCTVTVSDDTALQARVAASNDGDVICIDQSIPLSETLDLDDTRITFVGRDDSAVTLTAPLSGRHITVFRSGTSDDTLTIDRLTFKGGDDTTVVRGGIMITGAGGISPYGLDIRNSTFVNNVSTSGGAVMVTDDSVAIHISNSSLMNSVATMGDGGAIWTLGRILNVSDVSFTGNTASLTGGAISAPGSAAVINISSDSSFSGNRAINSDGGAIFTVGSSLAVSGTSFTNNIAGGVGAGGGAIYVPSGAGVGTVITIDDSSNFTGNQASGSGGAVRTAGASLTVSGSSFANNTAGDASGGGGAIHVPPGAPTAVVIESGTSFTANSATNNSGGAIHSGGPSIAITQADFVGNTAGGSGGGGGAVWTTGSVSTDASSFTSNTAVGTGGGGAIWSVGAVTVGASTAFANNSAALGDGGAIWTVTAMSVSGASFANNSSAGLNGGGAVWASSNVTSVGTIYTDNSTLRDGGAIWSAGASVTSTGDTLARNTATGLSGDGGAIYAAGGSVSATNSTFFRNSAVATGGAIRANGALTLRFVTSSDDSSAAGSVMVALTGPIALPGSAVSPAVSGGLACSTPADDSSLHAYATDSSCGIGDDTVTIASRSALGLDDTLETDDSTGAMVLIPDDTSILINSAPANLVSGVSTDQLQSVRGRAPDNSTTVGAVQVLPLVISVQPTSTSVSTGSTASFTVAGVAGVGTSVDYQWQTSSDGGTTWVDRVGATSETLTLNSVTTGQDGLQVRAQVSDLRNQPVNSATAALTVTAPSPGPTPTSPPSAPREVRARAGDTRATLTWSAPANSGSFPNTRYEVRSTPAGGTCLVATLTCTITGLTNGTAYTFEARALNGAGWGPWSMPSNAVTPTAPPTPSITITGSRGTGADRQVVFVTGTSTGLDGEQVRAHVKLRGQATYRPGRLVDVSADGRFDWQRTTGKKTYVYFTGGGVNSNRVIIPAARR